MNGSRPWVGLHKQENLGEEKSTTTHTKHGLFTRPFDSRSVGESDTESDTKSHTEYEPTHGLDPLMNPLKDFFEHLLCLPASTSSPQLLLARLFCLPSACARPSPLPASSTHCDNGECSQQFLERWPESGCAPGPGCLCTELL